MTASQEKPQIVIYLYPSEMRYVKPLEAIAGYIRGKYNEEETREKPSRHHLARVFDPLEEFLAGASGAPETLGKVMDLFARHYGFSNEDEKMKVLKAVSDLLESLRTLKKRDPVGVFKALRNMRVLLIGMATNMLVGVSFELREKQSQKKGA